jgi:hypothetical protein
MVPNQSRLIQPGTFEADHHWYQKALNAQIHPMVAYFFGLGPNKIINRYCHLNPQVDKAQLEEVLAYQPRSFFHSGADLFHVTNEKGERKMVVIENNSSPSGHKSMPLLDENLEQGGYRRYMEETFKPVIRSKRKVEGCLAVLYDKNPMEASGYAAAMADAFKEAVYYVPFYDHDPDPSARFRDHILEIRKPGGDWIPVRAAFRYVTQRPWNRIPVYSRTHIMNPVISCLAGGRNKMMAAKAYDFYNSEIQDSGMAILTPETIWDVRKEEIPLWVNKFGGQAVIKVPYANAGQGVFTIVNPEELEAFMKMDFDYDMFIVQSLIGNYHWSSTGQSGRFYQVGTMPNKHNQIFVSDIRIMVAGFKDGIRPLAIYARRARAPLADQLASSDDSWEMLGTNLSIRESNGTFSSDSTRLLMMDRRDFNKLGVSVDDLIEGYIQTVLSMIAIDKMAQTLLNKNGRLRGRLFRSLNNDDGLLNEILFE